MRFIGMLMLILTLATRSAWAASAELPVQYREGLVWLKIKVAGSQPLNFLLDTGAQVSVINAGTAKTSGLKFGERVPIKGVQSETFGYRLAGVKATCEGMRLPSRYLAVDLSKLSESCDCRVDGLLGADFLNGRRMQIDFAAGKLRFPEACEAGPGDISLKLKVRAGIMLVPMAVEGSETKWVRLDTGCVAGSHWVQPHAPSERGTRRVSIGLAETSIPYRACTVRLGEREFPNVLVGLHERCLFPNEAGLLGNGLLSHFRVTIDPKKSRVILSPAE